MRCTVLALGLVACGGAVQADEAAVVVPPAFWGPSRATTAPPEEVGELLPVPAGRATLGPWAFDGEKFVEHDCATHASREGTWSVRVAPFRFMRHEVTNRMYAACVDRKACAEPDGDLSEDPLKGPWRSPARINKPVAVSYALAKNYCESHGGKLPNSGQWVRAIAGDDSAFGDRKLTDAFIRCFFGRPEPLCDGIQRSTLSFPGRLPDGPAARPVPDAETVPWDVGPYGHRDLFAGATEWIRLQTHSVCKAGTTAEEGHDIEPDLVGGRAPAGHVIAVLVTAPYTVPSVGPYSDLTNYTLDTNHPRYLNGFRCAFPPDDGE